MITGSLEVPALLQCRAHDPGIEYDPLNSSSGVALCARRNSTAPEVHLILPTGQSCTDLEEIPTTHFSDCYSNFQALGGVIRK